MEVMGSDAGGGGGGGAVAGGGAGEQQMQQQQMQQQQQMNPRRRALVAAVCCLLAEEGADAADAAALETLAEALQSLLVQMGASARACAELAGRAEPLLGDVVLALADAGLRLDGLRAHAFRPSARSLPAPPTAAPPKALAILQAGVKQPAPGYVGAHLQLPSFPDPHAYIRTPTHKQPVTEYEAIREKSATQKRDVERALTRFVAKTQGDTHSLFAQGDDADMFPLVACVPSFPVYLKALLPCDQVFDFEEEFPCQSTSPQRPSQQQLQQMQQQQQQRQQRRDRDDDDGDDAIKDGDADADDHKGGANANDSDAIDNPYLRPVKLPRKKKKNSNNVVAAM